MNKDSKGVVIVAVGGNALIRDEGRRTVPDQYAAGVLSMARVAGLVRAGWNVVVTHGNGPQVGFILRRSEIARKELHEVPLDFCDADSQGAIGYMLQQALQNELRRSGIARQAVSVVTQTIVDPDDPAFRSPTKPIGSFMDETTAKEHAEHDGWKVVEDSGRGWRRVVASPRPLKIVEADAIRALIDAGFIVIGAGGGGIPVVPRDGDLAGVEAIIDKDLASALLGTTIHADILLIATAVPKVAIDFGKPSQKWLDTVTVAEARAHAAAGQFAKGSMLPKVEAAIGFVEAGGREAIICATDDIEKAVFGETGTHIVP
ncbi:MAG: carbamate kinase [Acidobacteria bacterium]|nr:carbamate kinase [Acidobacteriota bacterium]MCK6683131.1 carbamate kinase [Thermoanaerobaculia bacterium]